MNVILFNPLCMILLLLSCDVCLDHELYLLCFSKVFKLCYFHCEMMLSSYSNVHVPN